MADMWAPITIENLRNLILKGELELNDHQLNFWDLIKIEPEKWKEKQYGTEGGGFWVVAIFGRELIYYNDIEGGFNISAYKNYGEIEEYWCNQSDLNWTVIGLMDRINMNRNLNVADEKPLRKFIMKIWRLGSNKKTSLMLWRIEVDKFRVVQYDETAPLLTNADYVLMDKRFKSIIDSLVGQVETQDVVVYDKLRNLTWENYFEMKILNDIHPNTIKDKDNSGYKIWSYWNTSVFVSDDLKTQIQKIGGDEFEFTEGFSHFG